MNSATAAGLLGALALLGSGGAPGFVTRAPGANPPDAWGIVTFLALVPAALVTGLIPGLLVARYLGHSSEEAFENFVALWKLLRPAVMEREAVVPRIWST